VIETGEQRKALFRYVAHVGEVGGAPEAESADVLVAVKNGNPTELDTEGTGGIAKRLDLDAWAVRIGSVGREGVVVDAPKGLFCFGRCVQRDAAALAGDGEADGAKVVETENMVGVAVGVEDGVDAGELIAKRLLAEVRASVDEDHSIAATMMPLKQNGWTQSAVVGIGGSTDGTIATECRNSHGSSGAQKCEPALHGR
jgi:hypothetical protein